MLHRSAPFVASKQMTPARYLQLRRLAAGLTIEQVAALFVHRPEQLADVEKTLRSFETPGFVVKPWVAAALERAFRLDVQIYRALAEEPAERHPMLCASCGWDEWSQETDLNGDYLRWVAPQLCSRCDQLIRRAEAKSAASGQLL